MHLCLVPVLQRLEEAHEAACHALVAHVGETVRSELQLVRLLFTDLPQGLHGCRLRAQLAALKLVGLIRAVSTLTVSSAIRRRRRGNSLRSISSVNGHCGGFLSHSTCKSTSAP